MSDTKSSSETITDKELDSMIDESIAAKKKNEPLVTIGIPCYQAERYIYGAIKSALLQTYKNIEVIVIDDASTDETANVCKCFGSKIRLIRNEKNMGIGYGRLRIVQEAKGDFIAFCSADDVLSNMFVEEMLKKAEPDKILYSGYLVIDERGNVSKQYGPAAFECHDDFCVCCLASALRHTMFVNFSCILIPKAVFGKVNFDPKIRYGEDLDFLLRSMKHFSYKCVPYPLVKYRVHSGMTTELKWHTIEKNNNDIMQKWEDYWRSSE